MTIRLIQTGVEKVIRNVSQAEVNRFISELSRLDINRYVQVIVEDDE